MPLGSMQFPRDLGYGFQGLAEGVRFGIGQQTQRRYQDILGKSYAGRGGGAGRGFQDPIDLLAEQMKGFKGMQTELGIAEKEFMDFGPKEVDPIEDPEGSRAFIGGKQALAERRAKLDELWSGMQTFASDIAGEMGYKLQGGAPPKKTALRELLGGAAPRRGGVPGVQTTPPVRIRPQVTGGNVGY